MSSKTIASSSQGVVAVPSAVAGAGRKSALAKNLFGLTYEQLTESMEELGQPRYRARQILHAVFRERAASLAQVITLPQALREEMAKLGWGIALPEIVSTFVSADGTERYLIAGEDGQTVETVWMPEGDGGEQGDGSEPAEQAAEDRHSEIRYAEIRYSIDPSHPGESKRATICVSSQIGCAVNCSFCLTAKLGLQRNLSAGEIAGQVIAVMNRHGVRAGRDRINLVFMGMGEPFLNYDAFIAAVRLLVGEAGLAESRMTVSTSGIVPGIERFAAEPIRPKLAISLNGPNDAIREAIMPINRKWKIDDVIAAAAKIPLRPRERVTFEYVLLEGVNDKMEHAEELVRLARRSPMPVKVNLIAWNPGPQIGFATPTQGRVAAFQQRLIERGVAAFLRRPRGRDIYAACGQLKRTTA